MRGQVYSPLKNKGILDNPNFIPWEAPSRGQRDLQVAPRFMAV